MPWLGNPAPQNQLPIRLSVLLCLLLPFGKNLAQSPHPGSAIPNWERKLLNKFESGLYNSLLNSESGCVDCHSTSSPSDLVLTGDPLDDLRLLLDNGYLQATGPDSLLGRLTSGTPERRMPKGSQPWSAEQIQQARRLVRSAQRLEQKSGLKSDERFPRSLIQPYSETSDYTASNQFISYRQLVGKTKAIFNDDWVRGDRDLFSENVAMFGGADFEKRFNETNQPSATFLTGLEMLARDVATRAYQRQSGPFADWVEPTSEASELSHADKPHRQAIKHLFQAVLFRNPSASEVAQSMELLRGVSALDREIGERDTKLVFELTVTDRQSGLASKRTIEIPVKGDRLGVRQISLDQRPAVEPPLAATIQRIFRPLADQLASQLLVSSSAEVGTALLKEPFHLSPSQANQRLVIYNSGTSRNVSFAGVDILDTSGNLVTTISARDPLVQTEGAWEAAEEDGFFSYEDGNRHKGLSSIRVPLIVESAGEYLLRIKWRSNPKNTKSALVEVFAEGASNALQGTPQFAKREPGSALFSYDSSNDTAPYHELPGLFQFDQDGFVEISNAETIETVTVGAVEFLPETEGLTNILVDSETAVGNEDWSKFDEGRFKAYNVKGKKLHDGNKRKGELSLLYRPGEGLHENESYRIRVYYPGKRDQETRVPVKVVASASSPVIHVSRPLLAKADARLRMDASSSYTVQASELDFDWRQVSGPTVEIVDPHSPCIDFVIPRLKSRQFAWSGLCAALMRHPDFVFTHPPSRATATGDELQRLQLVGLAQDLVGRPPTAEELKLLASGTAYTEMVDHYLGTPEFREFYFHRIRLYLESQGTSIQDEPARIWSYIAFEDRPFQEILTADYTVDENFEQQVRPEHHGRTGVLTSAGFIEGKPGLPHYNYAAQVSMLFLGYVYEVPPEIVEQREGVTALGTTDPNSACYSCHKILTPLAFQRLNWTDDGKFKTRDEDGNEIDASDRGLVGEYPFPGQGLEAFATQAVKKERFIRTVINTHVNFYLGRSMRFREEERALYRNLWDNVHDHEFKIRQLIRAIVTSDAYLAG